MALVIADRVKETTTTTGTSDLALGGAASGGFQTFASGVGANNTCYYAISDGTNWEVGLGTLDGAGTTLARTTVLSSSAGTSKVSLAVGSKDVFATYPAETSAFGTGNQSIVTNNTSISTSSTIGTSYNGLSVGPITIQSGVAITVPSGQKWVVL